MLTLATEVKPGRAGVVTVECAYPHLLRFLAPLIGGFHAIRLDVQVAINRLSGLPPAERVIESEVNVITSLPRADDRVDGVELAGTLVLVGPRESLTRRSLEPALRSRGIALDIVYESHDIASLAALARAGLGVGVVADDQPPEECRRRLNLDPVWTGEIWFWITFRALSLIWGWWLVDQGDRRMRRRRRSRLARPYICLFSSLILVTLPSTAPEVRVVIRAASTAARSRRMPAARVWSSRCPSRRTSASQSLLSRSARCRSVGR